MAIAGIVTVQDLINQIREESDQQSSGFISDLAIATHINNSGKELYDILVGAYGADYFMAPPASFNTDNINDIFPLPDGIRTFNDNYQNPFIAAPFYKLAGLDLQLGATPQSYVTLRTFQFAERNRFAVPNFSSFYGFTNIRYRLYGPSSIWLTPLPASGLTLRLRYVARMPNIVSSFVVNGTIGTSTLTTADLLSPQVNQNIFGPGIPDGTIISAIPTPGTLTLSQVLTAPVVNQVVQVFSYTQTMDWVNGWDEYITVDACIKILGKEESDATVMGARKAALLGRIQSISENRDQGEPGRTADVIGNYLWGGDNSDGGGYGQW
jgi:hypothetical protein